MLVVLNDIEMEYATSLAKARRRWNKEVRKTVDRSMASSTEDLQAEIESVAAEFAFCRLHNVYHDSEYRYYSEYPAHDCILPGGELVDVKATKYTTGSLLAVRWKKPRKVDMFALMVGESDVWRYVGMIDSRGLLVQDRLANFGHGPSYAASQWELEMTPELARKRFAIGYSKYSATAINPSEDDFNPYAIE